VYGHCEKVKYLSSTEDLLVGLHRQGKIFVTRLNHLNQMGGLLINNLS
jgi:hypothetical protein